MNDFEYPSLQELRGTIHGTILYLSLYLFIFIQFQSYTKFYIYYYKYKNKKMTTTTNDPKKTDVTSTSTTTEPMNSQPLSSSSFRNVKYYNTQDLLALNGDRTVGNFMEQAIVFLPLLWIHAIFVNPQPSFLICCIYTSIRSIYPFVFYTKYMFLCTIPGYGIILYLMYQIVSNV